MGSRTHRAAIKQLVYLCFFLAFACNTDPCIKGDCRNGYGVLKQYKAPCRFCKVTEDTYEIYEGTFVDGKATGHGRLDMTRTTGCIYEGGIKRGQFWGKGVLSCQNGGRYEGSWKKGQIDGPGVIQDPAGRVYKGIAHEGLLCYEGDCRNGFGKARYLSGTEYVGEWKNGKFHGQGRLVDVVNRRTYEGGWKDDKEDGFGTRISVGNEEGRFKFSGYWHEGDEQGYGRLEIYETGRLIEAGVHKGTSCEYACVTNSPPRWPPRWWWRIPSFDSKGKPSYEGAEKDQWVCIKGDCINGFGTQKLQSGKATYTGEFKNGKRHGKGKFEDDELFVIYEGDWKNGLQDGFGKETDIHYSSIYIGHFHQGVMQGEGKIISFFADQLIIKGIFENNLCKESCELGPLGKGDFSKIDALFSKKRKMRF